jgi:hypothetical protein
LFSIALAFAWIVGLSSGVCDAAEWVHPQQPNNFAKPVKRAWIRVDARRSEFRVFTHAGQSFVARCGPLSNGTISGITGSVISIDENRPLLHDGTVLITGGKGGITIATRLASAVIPEGGAAVIDNLPAQGLVRLLNVNSRAPIKIRGRRGLLMRELSQGQLIVFSERDREPQATSIANDDWAAKFASAAAPTVTGQPIQLFGVHRSEFRCDADDTISLRKGELFGEATRNTWISAINANVLVNKGSIFDVAVDGTDVRAKAFSGPLEVSIAGAGRSLYVDPGTELLVSMQAIDETKLAPADGVGRRRAKKMESVGRLNVASADFSITSFLKEAPHMWKLCHPVSMDEKRILQRIMKTAAAVQTMNNRYGPYRAKKS